MVSSVPYLHPRYDQDYYEYVYTQPPLTYSGKRYEEFDSGPGQIASNYDSVLYDLQFDDIPYYRPSEVDEEQVCTPISYHCMGLNGLQDESRMYYNTQDVGLLNERSMYYNTQAVGFPVIHITPPAVAVIAPVYEQNNIIFPQRYPVVNDYVQETVQEFAYECEYDQFQYMCEVEPLQGHEIDNVCEFESELEYMEGYDNLNVFNHESEYDSEYAQFQHRCDNEQEMGNPPNYERLQWCEFGNGVEKDINTPTSDNLIHLGLSTITTQNEPTHSTSSSPRISHLIDLTPPHY